jgi:hypothetical protein
MSPEIAKEVAECHRKADEFKQGAEAARIPADKEFYVFLESSFRSLAEAYKAEAAKGVKA